MGSGVVAITDSRPFAFCRPSLVAGHFLLLAQKKVTKENGTLGAVPLAARGVRYGRTGFFYRPSLACRKNRRDPSRRPRAGHAAFPSTLRHGFRGNPRARADLSDICGASAAGTAALFALPGPLSAAASRRRKKSRSDRRQDAGDFAAVHGRTVSKARSLLAEFAGMDAGKPRPRGCPFLWLLSFGQAKESDRRPGMVDEKHTDVSRSSRNPNTQPTPSPPNPPLEGEGQSKPSLEGAG